MKNEHTVPAHPDASTASARRSSGIRFRTAAASSVLAAVTVTGIGATAAQAREPEEGAFSITAESRTAAAGPSAAAGNATAAADSATAAAAAADSATALQTVQGPSAEERLAGVRRELANAVSWGSVTAGQAERFYAQISSRIARGL